MLSRSQSKWERRYREHPSASFGWYLDHPPDQLVDLVERRLSLSDRGAALDLGCGPGVASNYLAGFFGSVVGVDISLSAVRQARDRVRIGGATPTFVVAAAPILPFGDETFSLEFDRGCLQCLPRRQWKAYFAEAARLLRPGGTLQLFVSSPTRRFPPMLSRKGIRARLRWYVRRRGIRIFSHDELRALSAPHLDCLAMEDSPFQLTTGTLRTMTHAVFQKAPR